MVSGFGKCFTEYFTESYLIYVLKELIFFKHPSSKEFHIYLWIFQYLCGFYLFGMTTTCEKFSYAQ